MERIQCKIYTQSQEAFDAINQVFYITHAFPDSIVFFSSANQAIPIEWFIEEARKLKKYGKIECVHQYIDTDGPNSKFIEL